MREPFQRSQPGVITRVNVNGSGRNSGETLIRFAVGDDNQSFWVFLDSKKPEAFFQLTQKAFEKMWSGETVVIQWMLYNGDQVVIDIVEAPRKKPTKRSANPVE